MNKTNKEHDEWYKTAMAEIKSRNAGHEEWLENMKKVSRTGTFEEILAAARSHKFK